MDSKFINKLILPFSYAVTIFSHVKMFRAKLRENRALKNPNLFFSLFLSPSPRDVQ